jgi:hypothetical protein
MVEGKAQDRLKTVIFFILNTILFLKQLQVKIAFLGQFVIVYHSKT